eukprot:symbB.v1.2.005963.t1/scaffold344.1/size224651/5
MPRRPSEVLLGTGGAVVFGDGPQLPLLLAQRGYSPVVSAGINSGSRRGQWRHEQLNGIADRFPSLVADAGFFASKLKTLEDPKVGKHLVTTEAVSRSEVLFCVDLTVKDGRLLQDPNMYSLQVSEHEHLDLMKVPDDKGGIARFLSHLGEPNLKPVITDQSVSFSAVRDLQPGEELGYHYCTTEWSMASPFECAKDGQSIQGYAHLNAETQEMLQKKELLASHIQQLASKLSGK